MVAISSPVPCLRVELDIVSQPIFDVLADRRQSTPHRNGFSNNLARLSLTVV